MSHKYCTYFLTHLYIKHKEYDLTSCCHADLSVMIIPNFKAEEKLFYFPIHLRVYYCDTENMCNYFCKSLLTSMESSQNLKWVFLIQNPRVNQTTRHHQKGRLRHQKSSYQISYQGFVEINEQKKSLTCTILWKTQRK